MAQDKDKSKAFSMGENVEGQIEGDTLVLRINLTKRGAVNPKSGKTIRVATTGGNQQAKDTGVFVGVNAYVYVTPK